MNFVVLLCQLIAQVDKVVVVLVPGLSIILLLFYDVVLKLVDFLHQVLVLFHGNVALLAHVVSLTLDHAFGVFCFRKLILQIVRLFLVFFGGHLCVSN